MSRANAQLVYILAASHSGSTLTAMLLNAHPEICTAGELKMTNIGAEDQYRCSCQSLLAECPFWNQVTERMVSLGMSFDPMNAQTGLDANQGAYARRILRPLHRGPTLEYVRDIMLRLSPGWRKHLPLWQARNLALVAAVGNAAGASYVVDSSKTAVRLKYLLRIEELNIKVVRLVRDGRAVALTYMDAANYADARDPGLRGGGSGRQIHEKLSMNEAATLWQRSNQEAEEVLRAVPEDSQLRISYENLCTETDTVLASIHAFLGLSHSENFKSFRSEPHHVVGNGMRLDSSSEIRLDDRWRQALGVEDLKVFNQVAGRLNGHYGYK